MKNKFFKLFINLITLRHIRLKSLKKKNEVNTNNPPEIVNLKSRRHFIEEVAKTIQVNHAKHKDSFIFGISGKWGEGKTTFLDELEKKMKELDKGFEIFRVNPWKFSSDKISFLRTFLKQLSITKFSIVTRIRNWLNNNDDFRNIDYDLSENKIHPGIIINIFLWLIFFILIYDLFPISLKNLSGNWRVLTVFTGILIPLFIGLIGKLISTQRSSRAISTIDRFDDLLKEILKKWISKKLIIFLDDLDRVTPETARDVLDNLRTFFDRKEITFVVTGDHSVLERHLGRELLSGSTSQPMQLEEGRRFLKKIFNVYWRLPLPIESELDTFLDSQFLKQSTDLNKILPSDENKKILKRYLKDYFERNFRQILRFVETILFTFRIIQNKKESSSEKQEKKYFEELTKYPLLVIRILTIQELCTPLFEKILESYEVFRSLEHAVEQKNQSEIDRILTTVELSPTQKIFINKFLFQEPRFYKDSSLVVSDLRPFLYLAADATFGDERGPSSADFVQIITIGNPKMVKESLLLSGDGKLQEAAKAFFKEFQTTTEPSKKKEFMDTLIGGLSELDGSYSLHNIFYKELLSIDLNFYKDIQNPTRILTQLSIWRWLDKIKEPTETWVEKFPFIDQTNFDYIKFEENEKAGAFTTNVVISWFNQYYSQNQLDALSKIEPLLLNLNLKIVKELINTDKLSEDLVINQNNDLRAKLLNILLNYSNKGTPILKGKVLNRLKTNYNDQNLWQWAVSQVGIRELWTRKMLEMAAINSLDSISDDQSLVLLLRMSLNNIEESYKELWEKIVNSHLEKLLNILPQIIIDQSFQKISPFSEKGTIIRNKTIDKITSLPDDSQKIQWLDYLKKDKWLWRNVKTKLNKKKINNINKTGNQNLQQKIDEVLKSWIQ